jgi:predicted amidohydrolase YtcJ
MDLVRRHLPQPGGEDRYRALRKGLDLAVSYGLTSVQDTDLEEEDLPAFNRLLGEGGLKVRFYSALPLLKDPNPDSMTRYREIQKLHQGPRFRLGGVKGTLDGEVEAKRAALLEPYLGGGTGALLWTSEDLARAATFYDRERLQVLLQAVGDKAIRLALDTFASAARANGPMSRRPRVERAELPAPADRARFKALGVVVATPVFGSATPASDAALLGPERAAQANALRLWDEAGVVQAFGSDWPTFSLEALKGIHAAVTGGTPGRSEAQGRITAEAALRHFTRDAAYACLEESVKGTLTPGRLADLVVLSDDILVIPPERILTTKVLLTVLGGQDTYRAREF